MLSFHDNKKRKNASDEIVSLEDYMKDSWKMESKMQIWHKYPCLYDSAGRWKSNIY